MAAADNLSQQENPEVKAFRSDLDGFLDEFAETRIDDVNVLNTIRSKKAPLKTKAEQLGLNFRLEIVHAESRQKLRKAQASKEAS